MNIFFTYWQIDLLTLSGLVLLSVFYLWAHHFKLNKTVLIYLSVLLLLVVCFCSPLHILSAHYLFSAHMIVHVLLLLVAGPLLLMSFSGSRLQHRKYLIELSHFLHKKPFVGWMIGVGIMWFWHLPFVFNYSMSTMHMDMGQHSINWLHSIESMSLIIAGMLFSWPLISPSKESRIAPLSGVVYLFTACIGCSLLGLLVTFAPVGMYHHFLAMHDKYNLNTIILNQWGMNQAMDQQIAGLIMWVPCCLLYVVYALYLLSKWFNEKDARGYMLHNR